MKFYVYCLQDPRDLVPRYMGLTNNPEKRLKSHLRPNGRNPGLVEWIAALAKTSMTPEIKVLEECDDQTDGTAAEERWIAHFQQNGFILFNRNGGGQYHRWSDKSRRRLSQTAKQQIAQGKHVPPLQSPETKAKVAQRNRERGQDPTRFIALNKSRKGIPLTEEHRRKLSEALKGRRWSEESRERLRTTLKKKAAARQINQEAQRAQAS